MRETHLAHYAMKATELAGLHLELGDMHAARVNIANTAYQNAVLDGASTTMCRHLANLATDHYDQEIAKLKGQIDGLLAELRLLDTLLKYDTAD